MEEKMNAKDLLAEMTSPERSRNAQLVKKWSKLLEGIMNPSTRVNMAKLYENEVNYLKQLTEETKVTNVGELTYA